MLSKYSKSVIAKIVGFILISSILLVGLIKAKAQTNPFGADKYYTAHKGQTIPIDPNYGNFDLDGDTVTITQINSVNIIPGTAQTISVNYFGSNFGNIIKSTSDEYTFTSLSEGSLGISFVVTDSAGNTNNGTLVFNTDNQFPLAADKSYTGKVGQPITFDPTQGNSDPDGDPITVTQINGVIITPGTAQTIPYIYFGQNIGTINISASGEFTFTSTVELSNFGLSFTVSDGLGGEVYGVIRFNIKNQLPIAANKSYTIKVGETFTFDPSQGNSDPDGDPLQITSISGTTITPGTPQTIPINYFGLVGNINISASGIYTFTPTSKTNLNIGFDVSDGNGGFGYGSMYFNIVDQIPIAANKTYNVKVGGTITFDPTQGNIDLDGDPTRITNINGTEVTPGTAQTIPVNYFGFVGNINISATGVYTFSPVSETTVNISITILDNYSDAAFGNIRFQITSDSSLPNAVNDLYTTPINTPVTVNPIQNDTDPNSNALTLRAIGNTILSGGAETINVTNGIVNASANGNLTFTPNANFVGVATFNYEIRNFNNKSSNAEVNINVGPINRYPQAVNDVYTTSINTPIVVNPIQNDTDPDGDPINIRAIGNTILSGGAETINVPNGVVNIDTAGIITFTPTANYIGISSFNLEIKDITNKISFSNVNIKIGPINRYPNAVNDIYTTTLNTSVIINPLANDIDPDGDTFSLKSINGTILSGGAETINVPNGVLNVDSSGVINLVPNTNFVGIISFLYENKDITNRISVGQINLNIKPLNRHPNAINDLYETNVNSQVVVNPISNDTEPDGDLFTMIAIESTAITGTTQTIEGANGIVNISSTGVITFTPTTNFVGIAGFRYTIEDVTGKSSRANQIIQVYSNRPPVASPDSYSTHFNTPVTLNPLQGDTDPDGDNISVAFIGSVTLVPNTVQTIPVPNGSVTTDGVGGFSFTPETRFVGTSVFNYTITDPSGLTANSTQTINVTNTIPSAQVDNYTTPSNTVLTINPLSNDTDVDNDTLIVDFINFNEFAYVAGDTYTVSTPNGEILVTFSSSSNASFEYTPNIDFIGLDSFSYGIYDGQEFSQSTINVQVTNQNPTANPDITSTDQGVGVEISDLILSNDTDPENQNLAISSINGQSLPGSNSTPQTVCTTQGAFLRDIAGTIRFVPFETYNGTFTVPYTISDGQGGISNSTIQITVNPTGVPTTPESTGSCIDPNAVSSSSSSSSSSVSEIQSSSSSSSDVPSSSSSSSEVSSNSSSYSRQTYPVTFTNGSTADLEIATNPDNSTCASISSVAQTNQNSEDYIQFRASCNQITIKTYWNNLNPNQSYTFHKYNLSTNSEEVNFPATISTETKNGQQVVVSTHTVTDNQVGDSNPLVLEILDPYTLRLALSSSSEVSSSSSSEVSSSTTSSIQTSSSNTSDSSQESSSSVSASETPITSLSSNVSSSSISESEISSSSNSSSSSQISSSSSISFSNSSSIQSSSSSSSYSRQTYPVTFTNGSTADLEIATNPDNSTCASISSVAQTNQNSEDYIQFRASCNQITIKTYWNNLNPNQSYTFHKYNLSTNSEEVNFPATISTETKNGQQVVVSTHTVTDNQVGDSNPLVLEILDPYTLRPIPNSTTTPPSNIVSGISGFASSIRSATLNILKLVSGGFGQSDANSSNNSNTNNNLNTPGNEYNSNLTNQDTNSISNPSTNLTTTDNQTTDKNNQNQKNMDGGLVRTGGQGVSFIPLVLALLVICYLVAIRSKFQNH